MLQQGFSYEDLSLLLTGGDQILTDKKKHFLLDRKHFPFKDTAKRVNFRSSQDSVKRFAHWQFQVCRKRFKVQFCEKSHMSDSGRYESPTTTHSLSLLQSTCSIRTDLGSSGTDTQITISSSSIVKSFRLPLTSPA